MERGVLNTDGNAISNKTFCEQFTFDTTGNWLNYKRDANGDGTFEVDQTRTHNLANEILTISSGNTLVSHDRNGCMTKVLKPNSWSSAYTLVYDAWNRLISVSDGDTLVATYVYDARNHRIKKTVGNTVTLSYFNRNWQEVESVTNNVTTGYVYGLRYIDDIICRTSGSETLYALQDPNWNVVALVTPSGTVAERMTYDSFGRVTFRNASFVANVPQTTSSYAWSKTFTGQVYDSETGLMLYRNRYYHPTLGKFITRDPIGYRGKDNNLYRYARNIPSRLTDSLGLESSLEFMAWYYLGLGNTFVIKDEEMLGRMAEIFAQDIKFKEFERSLKNVLTRLVDCDELPQVQMVGNHEMSTSIPGSGGVMDPLTFINGTTVTITYFCSAKLNCEMCEGKKVPESVSTHCSFSISLHDRCANPFDWHGAYYEFDKKRYMACCENCRRLYLGIDFSKLTQCVIKCLKKNPPSDLPGSSPYPIEASWTMSHSWFEAL